MLEFLNIKMDGFGVGESGISIWYKDGRLRYAYDRMPLEQKPSFIVKVPGNKAEVFLKKLRKLHVYKWKKRYSLKKMEGAETPQNEIRWAIVYKEEDKDVMQIGGMGSFPASWDKLIEIVSALVSENESVYLNHVLRMDLIFIQDMEQEYWNPLTLSQETAYYRYSENLTIDRSDSLLRYSQNVNEVTRVTHEYKVPEIIDYLLGSCERYFRDFPEETSSATDRHKPRILVSLQYNDGRRRGFTKSYDRHGVPDDWNELLEDIQGTMSFYGLFGPIFDESLYKHGVKEGEYIYIGCLLGNNGTSEFYRTMDDNLETGDLVIVPSEQGEGKERIAIVKEIRYCTRESAPCPPEDTAFVIRKLSGLFSGYSSDAWN